MKEVWDRIRRGDVYTVALTIPEGSNLFDIAAKVEAAGLGSKAAFIAAAKQDASLISDLDPTAPSLEGYLFPGHVSICATHRPAGHDGGDGEALSAGGAGDWVDHRLSPDGDPGVAGGEGNADRCGAAAGGQRLRESAGEEHAADDGSVGDLRGAAGRAVSGHDLPVGSAGRLGVQHVSAWQGCRRDRSAIRG